MAVVDNVFNDVIFIRKISHNSYTIRNIKSQREPTPNTFSGELNKTRISFNERTLGIRTFHLRSRSSLTTNVDSKWLKS